MKRAVFLNVAIIICLIFPVSSMALEQTKVDPYLKILSRQYQQVVLKGGAELHDERVSIVAKISSPESVKRYVHEHGGRINHAIGEFYTIELTLSALPALLSENGLEYAEVAKPLVATLNHSREEIGADAVQNGEVDGLTYTGKGVIVGVIDTGIDWSHGVFFDVEGNTRILSIWDQTIGESEGLNAPAEMDNTYGIECLSKDIQNHTCPSIDDNGHGTHVAAIAAGRGYYYHGIAPDSSLIVVKVSPSSDNEEYTPSLEEYSAFSTAVLDAMAYIFKKADALGMNAVINLSMGTHFGAHDDTSLLEQAMDQYVLENAGHVIVAAAGNERHQSDDYISSVHAGASLDDQECRYEFMQKSSKVHGAVIDIWGSDVSDLAFGIGVNTYDAYEQSELVSSGNSKMFEADGGILSISIDATESSNPYNGKKHVVVYIASAEGDQGVDVSLANYTFTLIASGSGIFDAWMGWDDALFTKKNGVDTDGYRYCSGDSRRTVGIPATADHVIAVGSYSSGHDFAGMNIPSIWEGHEFTEVGEISSFSSAGPSAYPQGTGQKPELTAPGEWIVSALSSDAISRLIEAHSIMDNSYNYVAMRGTSMAAPHVTGAVALLMEKDPLLTADKAEKVLARNAHVDSETGGVPNNLWGYGKLDIKTAMQNYDTTDVVSPLPVCLDDVPEEGYEPLFAETTSESSAGGCSLQKIHDGNAVGAIMFAVILFFYRWFRRRYRLGIQLAIIIIATSVSACGGSSGVSDTPEQFSVDNGFPKSRQIIRVSDKYKMIYFNLLSDDKKSTLTIGVPLAQFFDNKDVEVGTDSIFSVSDDQAYLQIVNYDEPLVDEDGYSNDNAKPLAEWIATEGVVSVVHGSIATGDEVEIYAEGILFRALDMGTQMINPDVSELFYEETINGNVDEGIDHPIVVDITPNSGPLGTRTELRGFNFDKLGSQVEARFAGCDYPLPAELISDNVINIKITGMCNDMRIMLNDLLRIDTNVFRVEKPVFIETRMPYSKYDLDKLVYDENNQRVMMTFYPERNRIYVYSIALHKYLESIVFPYEISAFDVHPGDGGMVVSNADGVSIFDGDYNEVQHISIADGFYTRNLTVRPDGNSVMLLRQKDNVHPQVAVLDINTFLLTYPPLLQLDASFSTSLTMIANGGRTSVVIYDPYGACPRRAAFYDLVGSSEIVKTADRDVNCEFRRTLMLDDEVWIGTQIYDAGLNLIGSVSNENIYPISDDRGFYQFRGNTLSIVDLHTGEEILSNLYFGDVNTNDDGILQLFIDSHAYGYLFAVDGYLYQMNIDDIIDAQME
jgi:subtilisin family serine protease